MLYAFGPFWKIDHECFHTDLYRSLICTLVVCMKHNYDWCYYGETHLIEPAGFSAS